MKLFARLLAILVVVAGSLVLSSGNAFATQTLHGAIVLGQATAQAPAQTASPRGAWLSTTGCAPGEIYCTPAVPVTQTAGITCSGASVLAIFGTHSCGTVAAQATATATGGLDAFSEKILEAGNNLLQNFEIKLATMVMDELSPDNVALNPSVNCDNSQGAQAAACDGATPWFKAEYSLLAKAGIVLVVPFYLLMVIRALMKKSLRDLIRGTLIVLPASVIGTAVLVWLVQMLLNISDDFCAYMIAKTGVGPNGTIQGSIISIDFQGMGMAALFWLMLWILATLVIYLELVLRQMGVYMTTFFMPLAFAAMVWPPAASVAKRMFEVLLGLIFSKVFIVATFALASGAFASAGTANQPNGPSQTWAVLQAKASGLAIFVMAAFMSTKVLAVTPAAVSAAEGRLLNTGNLWARGQLSGTIARYAAIGRNRRANNVQPSGTFHNAPGPPTGGPGPGRPPPPPPPPGPPGPRGGPRPGPPPP